jgi:hypothetical protein
MGDVRASQPMLLVAALFSRHLDAITWGRNQLEAAYGAVGLESPTYDFHHTKYYAAAMGSDLRKQLLAFEQLIPAEQLAEIKLHTNELERDFAECQAHAETRPLNIDPGILTLGKFMLATTKDQAHRVYLRDGIFAEVTLRYHDGAFEPWPWTYADYREPLVLDFLDQARDLYRQRLRAYP